MVLWCHREAARFSRPLLLSGRFPVPVLSVEVLFFGICFMTKVVCSPFPALLGVYFSWHCMVAVGSSYYHLLPWACYRTIRVGRTRMASDRDAFALVGWLPSRGGLLAGAGHLRIHIPRACRVGRENRVLAVEAAGVTRRFSGAVVDAG
jgi:hypothetical protein